MKKHAFLFILFCLLFTAAFPQNLTADENRNITKLAQLIETPSDFADKPVILEGIFAGRHCHMHFYYKEGLDSAKIECSGFETPEFDPGTPVRVKGIARLKQIASSGNSGSPEVMINIVASEVTKQ